MTDASATMQAFPVVHARAYVRTSSYSEPRTDRRTGARVPHHAVDIGAPEGAVIVAASGGRVVRVLDNAERECGFGVVIRDRPSHRLYTYCHMMAIPPLQEGETIEPGELLGYVGSTGRSTGPHLHLRVIDTRTGAPVDVTQELVALQRQARGQSPARRQAPPSRGRSNGFLWLLGVAWLLRRSR